MTTRPSTSWIHRFTRWYHSLSDEDSDTYFVKNVIKSTITMMVAVPFIKLLEAFVYYVNRVFGIPSQPLLVVNRPLIEVIVSIGDLAIVLNYIVLVVFGLANLGVRQYQRLRENIQGEG